MSVRVPWGLLLTTQESIAAQAQESFPRWLSDSERRRLAGLCTPARQSLFVSCRYALRLLLAQEEATVSEWSLGSAAERAPWVERCSVAEEARAALLPQLSLSHSGTWLACAKAPVLVGVDLEIQACTRQRDIPALAALVCAPAEQEWLLAQPADIQQQCFLQLWCLKEAYFKCLGTGVDFEKIRQVTWHCGTLRTKPHAVCDVGIAHARLWQAYTGTGEYLCLALCALEPLPELMPRQAMVAPELKWLGDAEWRLYVA